MRQDEELYTWLSSQLTPAKQNSHLWVELAEAIEEIFDIYNGYNLTRLEGLSSLLTMEPDDLNIVLDELGDFFLISEKVDGADRGIAAAQRFDEVHLKNTVNPIENILKLEFEGLTVEWQPLYIHTDNYPDDYGTSAFMLTSDEIEAIGGSVDNYVISSRAIIGAQASDLIGSGYTLDDLNDVVQFQIRPILPTQIVLDDTQLIYRFDMSEREQLRGISFELDYPIVAAIGDNETTSQLMIDYEFTFDQADDFFPSDLTHGIHFDEYSVDSLILDSGYE